jgi:hypothetical protein
MKQYLWVKDNFSRSAKPLRAAFDARFRDPKKAASDRFVWDFWHVPDQYTLLRTPADHFFPSRVYSSFLADLGEWASTTLGCSAITPPWLSYYIEGCEQKLHSDVPHGPWAFVYSLSRPRPRFKGGETLLLKPGVLDYWRGFTDARDRELNSFVSRISPRFNRLVVFDPRIPHGVTRVEGTMDPREARLVLHGWFTDPKPCLEGALSARQAAPVLDQVVSQIQEALEGRWHGVVSLRIQVRASGGVAGVELLADTLMPVDADPALARPFRALTRQALRAARFPRAKGATRITLPLLFR